MENNWVEKIVYDAETKFTLDFNYSGLLAKDLKQQTALITGALTELAELEAGAIANADEQRMVGHYWLRDSSLAPIAEIKSEINNAIEQVSDLVEKIKSGALKSSTGQAFESCVLIGIGGSALGPQFIEQALYNREQSLKFFYFDNTDPAGFVDLWTTIPNPATCLAVVISKSGGTRETRNGMLFAEQAFRLAGLKPHQHMLAITQAGSALDRYAVEHNWLARIPMWDWVGGRVSIWSAVGLLPAMLQGVDCKALLQGAAQMDKIGRNKDVMQNPALALALTWYLTGNKRGERILVMLPYRDQLSLLSKYLQQLIMESIGKELDRSGNKVNQGLYVLGNKGSTDQHSYIQQLREGPNTFLAHFIEVLKDNSRQNVNPSLQKLGLQIVEQNSSAGDYLSGFLQGTRQALYDNERPSLTITIPEVNAYYVGMLLALFERAVSFYASFINVNAYHQPGVEAGKKGAEKIIELQTSILDLLRSNKARMTADQLAKVLKSSDPYAVYCVLRHLAANGRVNSSAGPDPFHTLFFN